MKKRTYIADHKNQAKPDPFKCNECGGIPPGNRFFDGRLPTGRHIGVGVCCEHLYTDDDQLGAYEKAA